MKKLILAGASAALVLLLVIFAPDLLGLYRLLSFVEESSKAYEADGGPWPQLTDACTGCHGVGGSSLHQGYPSLAGQPAAYLTAQLRNFASGQRPSPNMSPLAMTLSDAEIKLVADYFAGKAANENTYFEADPALRQKGERVVAAGACAACHGAGLEGRDPNPRLAGQGYDYLVAQLDAFAAGTRTDPTGTMQKLAAALSAEDRKAAATYLASLAPGKQTSVAGHQE